MKSQPSLMNERKVTEMEKYLKENESRFNKRLSEFKLDFLNAPRYIEYMETMETIDFKIKGIQMAPNKLLR